MLNFLISQRMKKINFFGALLLLPAAFACQSGKGAERAFAKLEGLLEHPLHATLVLIDPPEGGLRRPSQVLCEQVRTLDKRRLFKGGS